jgi:hypothetical protein
MGTEQDTAEEKKRRFELSAIGDQKRRLGQDGDST